jgi:hypothetical protein
MSTKRRTAECALNDVERLWACINRASEATMRLLGIYNLQGMFSDAGERLEAYAVLAALRDVVGRLENIETFVLDRHRG